MSNGVHIENDTKETRYALQMLARHEMIKKLLADILMDMTICKLEGFPVDEFPKMIVKAVTFKSINYEK